MEEAEEKGSPGFNPWETLPSNHFHYNNLSPIQLTPYNHQNNHHNHNNHRHSHHDLAIFPPVNHEDLPIPIPPSPPPLPPPHAPLTLYNTDSDSHSSPPSPTPKPPARDSHLAKWVHFAFHLWNSKLISILTRLRSFRVFPLVRSAAKVAPYLVVLLFWVRRLRWWRWRKRRCGGGESVEQLKAMIQERDEKIVQLLEQIAQMNKILLARHRSPD